MIKKISVGIILLAILVSPNTAMSNGWGPFIGGAFAGLIISNVYNNCCGYRCQPPQPPAEGCFGPRWGVEDVSNVVECGFQEVCNFSAPGDTTIVGGILSHPVVGEFKWKAIGNGDRIFEGDLMKRKDKFIGVTFIDRFYGGR